nr:hypothetical protein CFP56_79577 [Quercus suber]
MHDALLVDVLGMREWAPDVSACETEPESRSCLSGQPDTVVQNPIGRELIASTIRSITSRDRDRATELVERIALFKVFWRSSTAKRGLLITSKETCFPNHPRQVHKEIAQASRLDRKIGRIKKTS